MRRNSLKVSREVGAGRCNVVSILESCICLHGVPEFHKVLSWEGSQKSWDRALREGYERDGHVKPQNSNLGSSLMRPRQPWECDPERKDPTLWSACEFWALPLQLRVKYGDTVMLQAIKIYEVGFQLIMTC